MSAGTLVPTLPPVVPPVPVRRFTVDEYHQMIRAGILGEDDNVELLEGWIVPKMPRNPAHDALIAWVHNRVLAPRLREGWYCRGQSAITTPDSEPEPDLAVIRGSDAITSAVIPDRPTRHLPWKLPILPWLETVRSRPGSTPRPAFLFTGSSIWSMTRSRSTLSRPAPTPFPIIGCARTTSGVTWFR